MNLRVGEQVSFMLEQVSFMHLTSMSVPDAAGFRTMITGCCAAICGNTVINLGTILMKKGTVAMPGPRPGSSESLGSVRTWHWWIGVLLWVTGNCISFWSMSMVNLTLLAALQSIQFVTNVIFSRFLLGDPVNCRTVVGTVVIVLGNGMVAFTSPKKTETVDVVWLRDQWCDAKYLSYVGVCLFAMIAAQMLYQQRRRRASGPGSLAAIAFVLASAPLGTQSNLQCKCLSTILSDFGKGDHERKLIVENIWFCVLILLVWMSTMAFWVFRLNMAVGIFPSYIIPILQVFWMICCIMNGIFYFGEGGSMTPLAMVGFLFGLSVVLVGVFILATSKRSLRPERLVAGSDPTLGARSPGAGGAMLSNVECGGSDLLSNIDDVSECVETLTK